MKQIILNRIKTPDGTILTSHSVHDFQVHIDQVSGERYSVDGGNEYLKRNINKVPYEEMSIYSDAPFEIIRQNYYRGTFDKNGNREWKLICDMTESHLINCIEYNKERNMSDSLASELYQKELDYRKEND